jgi:SagB-type dehydrogenase family enzyme
VTGDRISRRAVVGGLAALAVSPVEVGCSTPEGEESPVTTSGSPSPSVDLPQPAEGSVPLEVALQRRRSVREFAREPLTTAEIGQLLWAAQGVTVDWGGRTAPSAGAIYPLELHAVTPSRTIQYLPGGHRAEIRTERDLRPELMTAALDQEAVGDAPLVVAIVAVPARTAVKYGDRAGRYVDLEAGHAAQSLLLQAVAIGLVAVPIGAFDDRAVADILELPGGHEPRYLIPIGRAVAEEIGE